jgi:hypothetical protein
VAALLVVVMQIFDKDFVVLLTNPENNPEKLNAVL